MKVLVARRAQRLPARVRATMATVAAASEWRLRVKTPDGHQHDLPGLDGDNTFTDLRNRLAHVYSGLAVGNQHLQLHGYPPADLVFTDAVSLRDVLPPDAILLLTSKEEAMLQKHHQYLTARVEQQQQQRAARGDKRKRKRAPPRLEGEAMTTGGSETSSLTLEEALVAAVSDSSRADLATEERTRLERWRRDALRGAFRQAVLSQYDLTRASARHASLHSGRYVFQHNRHIRRLSDGAMPVVKVRYPASLDDATSAPPAVSATEAQGVLVRPSAAVSTGQHSAAPRKWEQDTVQLLDEGELNQVVNLMMSSTEGQTLLKPHNLCQHSPTVLWSLVHHHGPDVLATLQRLAPRGVDVSFLQRRIRVRVNRDS
jgi:hypothetical protein